MKSGIGPPSPRTLDLNLAPVTTYTVNMESPSTSTGSSVATLEPYESIITRNSDTSNKSGTGNSIYLDSIPLEENYQSIANEFGKFGTLKEIRVRLLSRKKAWEAWITFFNQENASKAFKEIQANVENANCFLVEKLPGKLDVYKPCEWRETNSISPGSLERSPKPRSG